jgi:hypothetical protein
MQYKSGEKPSEFRKEGSKTTARDLQIQINLERMINKRWDDLGSRAVQYLAKELPVREMDVKKTFYVFLCWIKETMIENPSILYSVQIHWGKTENVDYHLLIGEKPARLGWKEFKCDPNNVEGFMVQYGSWMIKELSRCDYLR